MKAIIGRLRRLELKSSAIASRDREEMVVNFITAAGVVSGSLVFGPNGSRTWTDFEDPNGPRTWTEPQTSLSPHP